MQLKRSINNDGSVLLEERGTHSTTLAVVKKRGFSKATYDEIVDELNRGRAPKRIAMDHCSEFTGSDLFKRTRKAVADLSYRLKKKEQNLLGMKYLDDVKDFINENIITSKVEFDSIGTHLSLHYYVMIVKLITQVTMIL
jgi:hypothetical protein